MTTKRISQDFLNELSDLVVLAQEGQKAEERIRSLLNSYPKSDTTSLAAIQPKFTNVIIDEPAKRLVNHAAAARTTPSGGIVRTEENAVSDILEVLKSSPKGLNKSAIATQSNTSWSRMVKILYKLKRNYKAYENAGLWFYGANPTKSTIAVLRMRTDEQLFGIVKDFLKTHPNSSLNVIHKHCRISYPKLRTIMESLSKAKSVKEDLSKSFIPKGSKATFITYSLNF